MTLYLLSILSNIQAFFVISGFLSMATTALWIAAITDSRKREATWEQICKPVRLLYLAAFMFVLAFLTPTQKDLIRAHLMNEGRQVITAENVQTFVDNFDRLTNYMIK